MANLTGYRLTQTHPAREFEPRQVQVQDYRRNDTTPGYDVLILDGPMTGQTSWMSIYEINIAMDLNIVDEPTLMKNHVTSVDNSQDVLQQLYALQIRLMKTLGLPLLMEHEEYLVHPIFKSAVDGLVTEAAEVLDALSVMTKPWKQKPIEEIRSHLLEESVDVLFMLLEIYILADITPEHLLKIYKTKLSNNLSRLIQAGRNKQEATAWLKELSDETSS